MTVSKYFTPMTNTNTQAFINQLVVQSIQANGLDLLYLPRNVLENDEVFKEALHERFDQEYTLEFVVEDIQQFNGMGHTFMVGFQMEDNITLVCARSRFTDVIGEGTEIKPEKGDVVYIQEADMMFQVDNVLKDEDWREWGANYVWRLRCNRYRAGHEEFDTGNEIFDQDIEEAIDGDSTDWPTGIPVFPDDTSGQASESEAQTPDIDIDFGER